VLELGNKSSSRKKWGTEEERENLNILLATLLKNSVIFKKWG